MSAAPNIDPSNETSPSPEPTSHFVGELESSEVLQHLRESTTTTTTFPSLSSELTLSLDSQPEQKEQQFPTASYYWDASTMASLNAVSAAAIARLRAYKPPPFPTWDRLHASRRAAVLVLLFADRRGDLRVVITMRAASLRNFSGHAAFPGGKADSPHETPYQIARREAWEEIGLPVDDAKIPKPFRIEPLCELPCSLARTDIVARPCVAFLHSDGDGSDSDSDSARRDGGGGGASGGGRPGPTVDEGMIPRLDAKEVAAVFSAPFRNFLKARDEPPGGYGSGSGNNSGGGASNSEVAPLPPPPPPPPGEWYDGYWTKWHGEPWRVHNFHVPVNNQKVTRPRRRRREDDGEENPLEDEAEEAAAAAVQRFLVWGFTGRILVDAARVAYAEEPEFEHNAHFGDEAIIAQLEAGGRLPEKKRRDEVGLEAIKEVVNETKI